MEAKQLQLGDFVSCLGDPVRVTAVRTVYDDRTNPIGIMSPLKIEYFFKDEDVKPVPLTAEILENNGFTKVNSQRYELNDGQRYINVNPKRGYIYVNGKKNHCNVYDNFTVHGFQHALRLCRLDELANNLKI